MKELVREYLNTKNCRFVFDDMRKDVIYYRVDAAYMLYAVDRDFRLQWIEDVERFLNNWEFINLREYIKGM